MQFNVSPRKHTQQPLHLTKPSIAYYSYQLQSVPPINVTAALAVLPACASLLCSFFVSFYLCITLYLYHFLYLLTPFLQDLRRNSTLPISLTSLNTFLLPLYFVHFPILQLCFSSNLSTSFLILSIPLIPLSHLIHPSHPFLSLHPSISSPHFTSFSFFIFFHSSQSIFSSTISITFFSLLLALANHVETCVNVILVMIANIIFSPGRNKRKKGGKKEGKKKERVRER